MPFVDTAVRLTEHCGLRSKISFRQGDVADLPFGDESFDIVWRQNVTMNVEDKPRLFAEAFRVLRPGRRYTFSHAAGDPGPQSSGPLGQTLVMGGDMAERAANMTRSASERRIKGMLVVVERPA